MFIWPMTIAWDLRLPSAVVCTDSMFEVSEAAVRPRMAVSMDCAKSGEAIALAMFSDPRLQEMSRPISSYVRSTFIDEGVETCRISEHRLEWVTLPAIGFARFTVSSNMMYG